MAHEHFYVKRSERESLVQPELIYTGLLRTPLSGLIYSTAMIFVKFYTWPAVREKRF